MERSDLGSPYGRAGCPVRGSLRGSHVPIYAFNHHTEYPLSQPVRLTALPKGEPRALPRQCDKLQFAAIPVENPREKPAELGFALRAFDVFCYFHRPSGYRPCSVMAFSAATTTGLSAA